MKVLGVVGADGTDTSALVDRLASRLAEDGTVAVISSGLDDAGPSEAAVAAATTTVAHSDAGYTVRSRDNQSVDSILERLAVHHDYALVENASFREHSYVALDPSGSRDAPRADGAPIAVVDSADDLDLETVVEVLSNAEPFETLESLVERVRHAPGAERAGAIATFTGRVRAKDAEDDVATEYLEFEKYDGVADERLAQLTEELTARDGVFAVELHHRTGVVDAGEDIVFVVVLAGHRREAFRTVEDGIDRLKAEVPLFKKEVTVEDEFWSHDRP